MSECMRVQGSTRGLHSGCSAQVSGGEGSLLPPARGRAASPGLAAVAPTLASCGQLWPAVARCATSQSRGSLPVLHVHVEGLGGPAAAAGQGRRWADRQHAADLPGAQDPPAREVRPANASHARARRRPQGQRPDAPARTPRGCEGPPAPLCGPRVGSPVPHEAVGHQRVPLDPGRHLGLVGATPDEHAAGGGAPHRAPQHQLACVRLRQRGSAGQGGGRWQGRWRVGRWERGLQRVGSPGQRRRWGCQACLRGAGLVAQPCPAPQPQRTMSRQRLRCSSRYGSRPAISSASVCLRQEHVGSGAGRELGTARSWQHAAAARQHET